MAEGGSISGNVESLAYRQSPIPQGGLEIPIIMKFSCDRYIIHLKMKKFVALYSYYDTRNSEQGQAEEEDDCDDDDDREIAIDLVVERAERDKSENTCIKRPVVNLSDSDSDW